MYLRLTFIIVSLALSILSCKQSSPNEPTTSVQGGPILFISDRDGTYQLYSMKADSTDVRQLTHDPAFPIHEAKYSPEGTRLVVSSPTGGDQFYGNALYVMNLDGTGRIQLGSRGTDYYATGARPVWSPDGRKIAFSRLVGPESRGNYDLFLINADGTGEQRLANTLDTAEYLGDWTADGSGLLSCMWTYGPPLEHARLALHDLTGKVLSTWGETHRTSSSPMASPSGKAIACTSNDANTQDIYLYRTDTSASRQKLTNSTSFWYVQPCGWSPDGKKVLFNAGYGDSLGRPFGKILLVDVETQELTDITPFKGTGAYSTATCWRK